jgi:hypothetical protein
MKFKWLKRITDYMKDKALSEKCGMVYTEICDHDFEVSKLYTHGDNWKCKKCGHKYDGF